MKFKVKDVKVNKTVLRYVTPGSFTGRRPNILGKLRDITSHKTINLELLNNYFDTFQISRGYTF
jgi:hypothetical protein